MTEFDTIIKGGTVVDGTKLPRYRADVGIKDGKVTRIGKLRTSDARKVLDAAGHIVAPGFVDVHTHLDGQIFWDPYCTTGGWHGVTSVVLGNCGFGFAPVRTAAQDRAMLGMSRNEQIPFASLKEGMPWDWETYPEFLDSLDRTPKGVNAISYMAVSPLMVWVMGLDDAKSGRQPTAAETLEMQRILDEGIQAGGCGWSAQRGGFKSMQADYDGSPNPSDVMSDELCVALAEVMARYDHGAIQISPLLNPAEFNSLEDALLEVTEARGFSEELARISGRPVIHNLVTANSDHPEAHREMLQWLAACHARGNRVIGQAATLRVMLNFNLDNNQTFDFSDVWREVLNGSTEDQLARIRNPEIRGKMIADEDKAAFVFSGNMGRLTVSEVGEHPQFENLIGRTVGDIAAERGTTPATVMLELSADTAFAAEFDLGYLSGDAEGVADLMHSPHVVPGPSDGGAHIKMTVGGTFGTDMLTWLVRDEEKVTLEEAHWSLGHASAQAAGLLDRGLIREGSPADILVYDLENLEILPKDGFEKAYDFPAGEWRRVQRSKGIRYTMVNGDVTFEDSECTGATPGRLLRHGRG